MKMGANFRDRNRIAELVDDGLSAEVISKQLKIHLDCIKKQVAACKARAEESDSGKAAKPSKASTSEMDPGGIKPQKG